MSFNELRKKRNFLIIFMIFISSIFYLIINFEGIKGSPNIPDDLYPGDFVNLEGFTEEAQPIADFLGIEPGYDVHMAIYKGYEWPDHRFVESGIYNVHPCTYDWLKYIWETHEFYEVKVDKVEKDKAMNNVLDWVNRFPSIKYQKKYVSLHSHHNPDEDIPYYSGWPLWEKLNM